MVEQIQGNKYSINSKGEEKNSLTNEVSKGFMLVSVLVGLSIDSRSRKVLGLKFLF